MKVETEVSIRKYAFAECVRGCVSFRNRRSCSVMKRKILFRFPWRPASPLTFKPQNHMTPGENTHMYARSNRQDGSMFGVGT